MNATQQIKWPWIFQGDTDIAWGMTNGRSLLTQRKRFAHFTCCENRPIPILSVFIFLNYFFIPFLFLIVYNFSLVVCIRDFLPQNKLTLELIFGLNYIYSFRTQHCPGVYETKGRCLSTILMCLYTVL